MGWEAEQGVMSSGVGGGNGVKMCILHLVYFHLHGDILERDCVFNLPVSSHRCPACGVSWGLWGLRQLVVHYVALSRERETHLEMMAACVTQPTAMEMRLLFFTLRPKETCVFYCKGARGRFALHAAILFYHGQHLRSILC